jgi:hypothetical protein
VKRKMTHKKKWIFKTLLVVLLGFTSVCSFAQINPTDSLPGDPGALSVYTVQHLSFGAFSNGNAGGTVLVSSNGARSVTGDVVGLNLGVSAYQSIFEIDAPSGSIISILNGPDATLNGSNGGTMSLRIGNSNPSSPFITMVAQPARTSIHVGGTLTVGGSAANPPGTYAGTFYITFNYE